MATPYQMDPVIRRIEKSERHVVAAEGLVVDVPRSEAWFAEKWYYRVARPHDGKGWARLTVERDLDAPERDWRLPIQVIVAVQFSGSGEAEARALVNTLKDFDNPDHGMTALVGRWIDGFAADHRLGRVALIEELFGRREPLKAYIVKQAALISLLVTRIDIVVRGERERAEVLEVRAPNMLVILSDYTPEVALTLDVDLRVAPGSVLAYLPSGLKDDVDRDLRREIRELFRTHVNLQQWQYDLQGTVKSRVESVVRDVAARAGRDVARLMISGKPPIEGVQRSLDVAIPKEQFRQLDYPDPVEVDAVLRLDLVDLGTLVNSGVAPNGVENWARLMERDAITHKLLDEPYVDLFDRFQDKISDTERALASAARTIGYTLTRVTLQTNLDFDVLQRGFECRIENATFPLTLRECEIVLDIETRLRITDRDILRNLFKKSTGIKQTIEARIRSTVAEELRGVSPEDFYLRFHGDDQSTTPSVASRLETAIRDACADFEPDGELTVHFARRPDELMKVYLLLVQTPLSLTGLKDPNSRMVVDVNAWVTQIYGAHWRRFQELKPTPEMVRQIVAEQAVSFINEALAMNLGSLMSAGELAVKAAAERWVNAHLAKALGVGISIDRWYRHDPLVALPLDLTGKEIADLIASLEQISTQLQSEYLRDGDASRLQDLEDRRAAIKKAIEARYRERGTTSILTPTDPSFRIAGPSAQKLLAAPDGGPEDEGPS